MSRVVSFTVFDSNYPVDTTFHRDLFYNKLRSNQTYVWSFAKDSATYNISTVDNSLYGQVAYTIGDETKAAHVIYNDRREHGPGGYDVVDVTLFDRPDIVGNIVTIMCSGTQDVLRAGQELDFGTNQLIPKWNINCNKGCLVFTLK